MMMPGKCQWWMWNTAQLRGAVSGLKQFLATGSPLKVMKNAFISP